MGLSASQMRFLMLTGRKSDVEFQGQQVNQQRTALAQESQGLFNTLLNLHPPAVTEYAANSEDHSITWTTGVTDWKDTGAIDTAGSITGESNAVNDHYEQALYLYNQKLTLANTKIEEIHAEDRALELRLKNLDTQQQAIQTEMDAVQKVIDKNIEMTFKTFA